MQGSFYTESSKETDVSQVPCLSDARNRTLFQSMDSCSLARSSRESGGQIQEIREWKQKNHVWKCSKQMVTEVTKNFAVIAGTQSCLIS